MKNGKKSSVLDMVNTIMTSSKEKGIIHQYTEDTVYNGRDISINGKKMLNFGSCSYLGLEIHPALKQAAIDAIEHYGIQYSSSRAYVSTTLYKELEELLFQIFGIPPLVTPTTSLGHIAVIPTLVEPGDAIILDQQVHASVQYPSKALLMSGVTISSVGHNKISELEKKIKEFTRDHKRIWYMADGVYSMYGDVCPIKELTGLQKKYPNLYLYIDDAHSTCWYGKHGRGFTLSKTEINEKMIIAHSFAKSFGAGGACFIIPDQSMRNKVRNCGGPMIFSGPIQIPTLGACIASAKICLSEELKILQHGLMQRITYCHRLLLENNIPICSEKYSPIKFVALGHTKSVHRVIEKMMKSGFFTNLAIFPAVPVTCTGIRFTLTNHLSFSDIKRFVETLKGIYYESLYIDGHTIENVNRAYRKVSTYIPPRDYTFNLN